MNMGEGQWVGSHTCYGVDSTARHQLLNMHSLVSGVLVHISVAAGDSIPPSYRADTSKQYSANPSASCSVYEVAVSSTCTDIVLLFNCRFTNWLGSHLLSRLYCTR